MTSHAVRGAPAIADYALLSDSQGAALVSRAGSIDWWCAPRFDSRSAFGRILDADAGHWSLGPTGPADADRVYVPGTMVVETTFTTAGGRVRLRDALALAPGARDHEIGMRSPHTIVRVLEGLDGEVEVAMEMVPRTEYGLVAPELVEDGGLVRTFGGADRLLLRADGPLRVGRHRVDMSATVRRGDVMSFALRHRLGGADEADAPLEPVAALEDAIAAWRSWAAHHDGYRGYAWQPVRRSAFVLQALTYAPSGAIVAAPTTSLPEIVGGGDNWDYRFAWLRDASLTLEALSVATCPDEAEHHFAWMARAATGAERDGGLQIVFGVEGERDLTEHALPHLRGYRGSTPVRVGNDAWRQTQLDVYGEVLASAHILRDALGEMDDTTRRFLVTVADLAAERWAEPDAGIWEARGPERHYTSSKTMCWVALDRALAMAGLLGAGDDHRERWGRERARIRETVLREAWCEEVGAYTGALGSDHLDASVLLLPLIGFLPAGDPRMRRTIDVIERDLATGGLVRRWTGAEDGGFVICSFWLADCLARAGEVDRAVEVFEEVWGHANDVGLLAEQIDPRDGSQVGNFPQGLSHVGLISAACSIDRARRAAGDGQEATGRGPRVAGGGEAPAPVA